MDVVRESRRYTYHFDEWESIYQRVVQMGTELREFEASHYTFRDDLSGSNTRLDKFLNSFKEG